MTRIAVLTKPDCSLCDHAKEVLARLTPEFDLELEFIEVDSERGRRLAEGTGMVFPPAVLVDGEPFSYGRLSERKLRRTLTRTRSV